MIFIYQNIYNISQKQPCQNKSHRTTNANPTPIIYIKLSMNNTSQGHSHIVLCILATLLATFSIAAGIGLMVTTEQLKDLSGIDGFSLWMLVAAVVVSLAAIAAIVCSWKKVNWFLHFYQFVCLVLLICFVLALIAIVMVNIQRINQQGSTSTTTDNSCFLASNYFQFKMLQTSNKANALLCSQTCPCPQNQHVSQCPGWNPTPYDTVFQKLQNHFKCSGWCVPNPKAPFIFSNQSAEIAQANKVYKSCHEEWANWVNAQWRAVVGCISTLLAIIFANVVFTNWRILQICQQLDNATK